VGILSYRGGDAVAGSVSTGLCVPVFLLVAYREKLKRFLPVVVFLIGWAFYIGALWLFRNELDDMPLKTLFYGGYAFGLASAFLQQLFPAFEAKLVFALGTIAARYLIVTPRELPGVLSNAFFDLIYLWVLYIQEKRSRNIFLDFHDYRNENSKFKTLIREHLPEIVLIFDKDLAETLFVNNSFKNNFNVKGNTDCLNALKRFKIQLSSFNRDKYQLTELTFASMPDPSLFDFLQSRVKNPQSDGNIISFNLHSTDENQCKLIHEAKVFSLKWDKKEAIAVILNDLTQQETILALKLADENKDKVLATVSHELRTPINGMLGIIHVMEKEFEDHRILSYCRTAKVCSKMLLNLVNSILDLTQIRNNCIKLNPSLLKISDLLEEIELIFRTQIIEKSLEFDIIKTPDLPDTILSDSNRLTQIIVNLLANALKFTFKGSINLKVSIDEFDPNYIKFEIQDTGIGIKDEDKPKLFKMFGRIDQASAAINTQGVGLGLTISNSLVKMLNPERENAKIDFQSEYGRGTTFSFSICTKLTFETEMDEGMYGGRINSRQPMLDHEDLSDWCTESVAEFPQDEGPFRSEIHSPRSTSSPLHSHRRLLSRDRLNSKSSFLTTFRANRNFSDGSEQSQIILTSPALYSPRIVDTILVVDDNTVNILIMRKILEKYKFNVVEALNGQEAVNKAKERSKDDFFKIIFMDCQMPIMDGYEATRILKEMMQNDEIPNTPIFAVTANDTKKDQELSVAAGMSEHLAKPLNHPKLLSCIRKYCPHVEITG